MPPLRCCSSLNQTWKSKLKSPPNEDPLSTEPPGTPCRCGPTSSLRRVSSFPALGSSSRAASHSSRVPVLCVVIVSFSLRVVVTSAASAGRASRVAELGSPISRAARQKIEDVPKGAEVIAGFEGGIGHAHNPLAIALEHGNAGQPATALGAIAHVRGEARTLMADHRKLPAAALGKALLHLWRIGARHDHRRAIRQMVIDAVQSVGPQRAVGAGGAHVVDKDQVSLTGE